MHLSLLAPERATSGESAKAAGGSAHRIIVGVALLAEPQPEKLLVHILRLLGLRMPLFIRVCKPIPAHEDALICKAGFTTGISHSARLAA